MNRRPLSYAATAVLAAALALPGISATAWASPAPSVAASSGSPACGEPLIDEPASARSLLGPGSPLSAAEKTEALNRAADALDRSPARVASIAKADQTLMLDECGNPFYREPTVAETRDETGLSGRAASSSATAATYPLAETFNLESKPGSDKTIYLDFLGDDLQDTIWNDTYHQTPYQADPFSIDGDYSTFSDAEKTEIQYAWQIVADDFAPFDVNVTTKPPVAGQMTQEYSGDPVYGLIAYVAENTAAEANCGCGGLATVGITTNPNENWVRYYGPAMVFPNGLGDLGRNIGEAASHEIGHNLGLLHDGIGTSEYYCGTGSGVWAPIMGCGYYAPLSQWSKGEYAGATQQQDDLAIINQTLTYRPDSQPDTNQAAVPISFGSGTTPTSGSIERTGDVDAFKFTATSNFDIQVEPTFSRSNVDLRLDVIDATTGATYATVNPTAFKESYEHATGTGATGSFNLPAGGPRTYIARVSGTGQGNPAVPTEYSNYGSLGAYTIKALPGPGAPVDPPTDPLVVTAGPGSLSMLADAYFEAAPVTVTGGKAPYSFSATGLPNGMSVDAETGTVFGYPHAAGSGTITIYVLDAEGTTAHASIGYTVTAQTTPLTVSAATSQRFKVNTAASVIPVTASGGTAPYSWTATGLPAGLSITPGTGQVTGTPTTAGAGTMTITAHDSASHTASASVAWVVDPDPQVPPVVFNPVTLPTTEVGRTGITYTLTATGGTGTYDWTASGLPPGVTLNASTGVLSGTPVRSGDFSAFVTVGSGTAPNRAVASATVTVTVVDQAAWVTSAKLPNASRGNKYAFTLAVRGGQPGFAFVKTAGALPPGLRLTVPTAGSTTRTATLSGRAKRAGLYHFTVVATDSLGVKAARSFTVRVR